MIATRRVVFWLFLTQSVSGLRADWTPKWEKLESWSSYVQFEKTNGGRIADLTNVTSLDARRVVGLRVNQGATPDWGTPGKVLTNVACLRISTSAEELSPELFSSTTNYRRLQYMYLECRRASAIPSAIGFLTNNVHLRYLGIDAPVATNVDSRIYQIKALRELFLHAGAANLPAGVAQLSNLARLEIHGVRASPLRNLPDDLEKSSVKRLIFANVLGVEKLLPVLPSSLVELSVLNCRLHTVPKGWLNQQKLEVVDLNHNELAHFPDKLLEIPSLKLLALDLNDITTVPPLRVAGRDLAISLVSNPIHHFAPENNALVLRGIIQK